MGPRTFTDSNAAPPGITKPQTSPQPSTSCFQPSQVPTSSQAANFFPSHHLSHTLSLHVPPSPTSPAQLSPLRQTHFLNLAQMPHRTLMPYRIQITHIHGPSSRDIQLLPHIYPNLDDANMDARDLAEVEYCIPNLEEARCVIGVPGMPQEWVVCDVYDRDSVRIVVRVIKL